MTEVSALSLQLLKQKVPMPDLLIKQAMDIAKIPERFNEKRISALITHTTGDSSLADTLTVQERYYLLLNQQALSHNKYAIDSDFSDYYIDTIESEVPDDNYNEELELGAQHLRGAHVCLLETLCEDLFDWTCGLIACQLYGNISSIIGGDMVWDKLEHDLTASEMNRQIQGRAEVIRELSEFNFNNLVDIYERLIAPLIHYVEYSIDNQGITVLKEVAGEYTPARFQALSHLQRHAKQLAKYIA